MKGTSSNTGENGQKAVRLVVRGRVQGVGFRYYAQAQAQRLGVAGWVRNRADGAVEIWAEGSDQRLRQFIKAVRQGPSYSNVESVDLDWTSASGQERGFRIRY